MSRTLLIIRHAKSGWSAGEDDHARTLTDKGQRDATRMGDWIRDQGHIPDLILCSSATRTRQTAVALALGPEPRILDALYQASCDQIHALLAKETAKTVAVIAHNPGIAEFARTLTVDPGITGYPPCAVSVLSFETDDWSSVRQGRLMAYRTPKDLRD